MRDPHKIYSEKGGTFYYARFGEHFNLRLYTGGVDWERIDWFTIISGTLMGHLMTPWGPHTIPS